MAWTDERVETLKKLWADGLSASQIAKQLGGVTRNAVIGKVHRLGLSGRAAPSRPARRPAPRPAAVRAPRPAAAAQVNKTARNGTDRKELIAQPAPAAPPPAPVDAKRLANGEYATVLTLREGMCKWPIGDPADSQFRFCGHPTKPGAAYCEAHAQQAYQPQAKRKRKPSDDARAVLDSLQTLRRANF
ncbi:GcrA cell cycle regulator [Alkalicaulis satelles]|uniref:GcrA cell cycle regulator n=1 Tax=Alkalicaulis satelles TaxID=2609175 RepID=A0A5M6ZCD7_9PROT|nr:GcrA family cell cycle regulator [Alkalicaulis satelles]KAA5801554.1 GcrA cell cycle regulator [Alkalicaulis satelles]